MKKFENESEEELRAKDEFRKMILVNKAFKHPNKVFKDEVKETDYPTSGIEGTQAPAKKKTLAGLVSDGL